MFVEERTIVKAFFNECLLQYVSWKEEKGKCDAIY